ncbi:MAG: cell division protein FtsA [Bacteroides sp.]
MATTEFIAAIELGSSKVTGIAGRKNSDGSMQVLAYAKEDSSSFIRKGVIYNLDKTAQSLTSIINKLEGELKNSIAKVYVGIGGQSLRTVRNVVSRSLSEEVIISQELVDSICDENLEIPLIDMDVLDVAPQEYKIGNNAQADPVGVAGSHIEGRFLNIVARSSIKKNLERCFDQSKIEIADLLIAPLVTANAVLTESERRSGCALVDFGADTTTISVYKNNILRFLTVLPLGGNSITRDITALQMEEEEAEWLKVKFGNALYEEENSEEAATCSLEDGSRTIELLTLNNIIEARLEEIIANVWNQLQLSGYDDKLLSGVVITGGAANLKNLEELFRKRCKIDKVRTARTIRNTIHMADALQKKDGSQNTLFGLLFEGKENCCLIESAPVPQPVRKPEPEPASVGGFFDEDEELKKQEEEARAAKKQKDEDDRRRKEEERKRKEEEKRKKQEAKRNKPSWIKSTFDKLSNEIFSDEDMK